MIYFESGRGEAEGRHGPISVSSSCSTSRINSIGALWEDRLLIKVSNNVFIVLTVHNSLSTLILIALELKLHV
jgi:hypothetical protein